MIAYKVLTNDFRPPLQGGEPYELGREYECKDFDPDAKTGCSRGYYATETIEGCLYVNNAGSRIVFECDVRGDSVKFDVFKQRWQFMTIVRPLPELEIRALAKAQSEKRGYNIEGALLPIHPFLISPTEATPEHLDLLKSWDSVWDSVGDSVWDSVRDSVWASVRDSVWDSVGASVWAYIGALFPGIKKWEYIDHAQGVYPFQSAVDLWKLGLVPSWEGKLWRLHGGEGAKVLWEGKI